jgi:hypothetical protein
LPVARLGPHIPHLICPLAERVFVRLRQPGIGMNEPVASRRHGAVGHGVADFLDFVGCSQVWGAACPRRKVQVFPSTVHVMLNEPGNQGDSAAPRPPGFVAVAIETGPIQNWSNGDGNLQGRAEQR